MDLNENIICPICRNKDFQVLSDKNIRINSISPGDVNTGQPDEFVKKLANLIPLGRMANLDEYKAAIIFLCSDASSYMTGANIVIDGGRTCW